MAITNPPPSGAPGPHHVTHEPGGGDAITALSGSVITTGTVADARLSPNVPLLSAQNVFLEHQSLRRSSPTLILTDTLQGANQQTFRLSNQLQTVRIAATDDAIVTDLALPLSLDRQGNAKVGADLYEKTRPTPIGHWIDVPYSAANFGATGGTWTVTSLNVTRCAYALIGKTAHIQIWIDGSVVGGAPASLNVVMPFTILSAQSAPCYFYVAPDAGWGSYVQPGQDQLLRLQRDPYGTPFAAASGAAIRFSAAVQIL